MTATEKIKTADDPASGFIRFETDVTKITSAGIFSPQIEVLGTPCIDADITFSLYNKISTNLTYTTKKAFTHEITSWGYPVYLQWKDLIDEKKGYINNDKIIIEIRFTLSNVLGLGTLPHTDFTDPNESTQDVTLMIEGEKIYVNKGVLAVHSPVFKTMFFGNFAERKQSEIELKDIKRKDFIEMLNLIYPVYQKITDDNAKSLLILADRYQVQSVINKIELFFIDSSILNVPNKLKLSDQYRLAKLQDHCLDTFKTAQDVMNLKTSNHFDALSETAKTMLLLKAMSFS